MRRHIKMPKKQLKAKQQNPSQYKTSTEEDIPEYGWGGEITGGLEGAASGALAGSSFGPWGAGIGAGIGLVTGAVSGSNQQDAQKQQLAYQQAMLARQSMMGSGNMYVNGGIVTGEVRAGVRRGTNGVTPIMNNNPSKMGYYKNGGMTGYHSLVPPLYEDGGKTLDIDRSPDYQGSDSEDEQKQIEGRNGLRNPGQFQSKAIANKTNIEVQGEELEVSKGKIIKDFKGKQPHTNGGYKYSATPGNTIIPANMRSKYLEGDSQTRNTIELQLRRDQQKRDAEELKMYREGGHINIGGMMRDAYQMGGDISLSQYTGGFYEDGRGIAQEQILSNNPKYKSGGTIHIKPENRGKFTAYKARTGKTTEEALHSKDPHVRQMANFARNAARWKHEKGGKIYANGGLVDDTLPGDFSTQDLTNDSFNKNFKDLPSQQTPWNKYAKLGAASAPLAYDLGMYSKGPEYLNPEAYQNPYEGQTRSLMANRKINMKPITDRILNQRQVSLDNAKNSQAMSGGAYLSNASQIGASTQQNLADAQMKEQEANNRYRGEEAGVLGNLGEQRARTNLGITDINMRTKAATNKALESAAFGVSRLGQGQIGDNQKATALKYLFGEDDANDLLNYYRTRKGGQ